jgi:hypothetical protein
MAASGKSSNYEFPYPLSSDVVDVAGDLELLAKKIDTSLGEVVQDTIGGMVSSNTENGISVTYNDELGKLDFDVTAIPSQTGNTGKYLTTDGSVASWAEIDAGDTLPSQTGNTGKYLTTDGSVASWAEIDAVSKTNGIVTTATPSLAVVRNITLSTSEPSGGMDGDVWMVYS